jgi:MATE family multidrug resistance protein
VAIPAILTSLSANLMYFIDRTIVAVHSSEAMYAVTASGNFVAIITWLFVGVASTSEIFVGQYNGQEKYDKIPIPIWQMIYMSLIISIVIFLPIGYFAEHICFLPEYAFEEGLAYQRILLYFGAIPSLFAGLAAFYIGRGKTVIITIVVVLGNIINAALDYFFVLVEHKGAAGVAIATVIAEGMQILALAIMFLSKRNREKYQTLKNRSFDKKILIDCFKIGTPLSIGNFFSILAWWLIVVITGFSSKTLGIIYGIGVNIYVLISFFAEGLNKAVAAIASNMIGMNDIESIKLTYKRFVFLLTIFSILTSIPMIFYQKAAFSVLGMFIGGIDGEIASGVSVCLTYTCLVFFVEAIEYVTWGTLVAGGDTKYPTIVSQGCLWCFMVIPAAIMYYFDKLDSVNSLYMFMLTSFIVSFCLIYRRYRSMKWFKKLV